MTTRMMLERITRKLTSKVINKTMTKIASTKKEWAMKTRLRKAQCMSRVTRMHARLLDQRNDVAFSRGINRFRVKKFLLVWRRRKEHRLPVESLEVGIACKSMMKMILLLLLRLLFRRQRRQRREQRQSPRGLLRSNLQMKRYLLRLLVRRKAKEVPRSSQLFQLRNRLWCQQRRRQRQLQVEMRRLQQEIRGKSHSRIDCWSSRRKKQRCSDGFTISRNVRRILRKTRIKRTRWRTSFNLRFLSRNTHSQLLKLLTISCPPNEIELLQV